MKNRQQMVSPFPKPLDEPAASTIVVQIGKDRFAIHWEMEELPPAAPTVRMKQRGKQATMQIVK
jgi:hypothetical protein